MKNFKPKQSVLEIGIIKSQDLDRMNKFSSILSTQNDKVLEKIERKEMQKQYHKKFEKYQEEIENKVIQMKNKESENDQKLQKEGF